MVLKKEPLLQLEVGHKQVAIDPLLKSKLTVVLMQQGSNLKETEQVKLEDLQPNHNMAVHLEVSNLMPRQQLIVLDKS